MNKSKSITQDVLNSVNDFNDSERSGERIFHQHSNLALLKAKKKKKPAEPVSTQQGFIASVFPQ